ncbi:proton-conducting transporter membrane subunit [Escherichia coli]
MGLVAVALGIGGPLGIFAALLHILNHSLAKTLLFCGSGNVLPQVRHARSQRRLWDAQNHAIYRRAVWRRCRWRWQGCRPFNIFLSEFMTITAGLARNHPADYRPAVIAVNAGAGGLGTDGCAGVNGETAAGR